MKGVAGLIRENLEAFAVAIAMALVIRHFCLEAFRIPTGSMMPTLYGDDDRVTPPRHGDRILVDKVRWMQADPRRYEVAVFHFPLNRSRNFIKRIAGLGGEWLRLIDGDIWTSTDEGKTWSIARKPAGVRDQLLIDYYPRPTDDRKAFENRKNWDPERGWAVDEAEATFRVDAPADGTTLEFSRRVLPYNGVDDGRGNSWPFVGDIRISFDVDVTRAGVLEVVIQEHGIRHWLVLGPDASYLYAADDPATRIELDARTTAGASFSVSFANVDDALYADIDGQEIELPFVNPLGTPPELGDDPGETPSGFASGLELRARNLAAEITDIDIDRDVYYREDSDSPRNVSGETVWKIPNDHYFMLGDNNNSSQDSRKWRIVRALLNDGTTVEYVPGRREDGGVNNPGRQEPDDGDTIVIDRDSNGLRREIRGEDIAEWEYGIEAPFVPRNDLIGRALCVFWPIHIPLKRFKGPTRIKLIR